MTQPAATEEPDLVKLYEAAPKWKRGLVLTGLFCIAAVALTPHLISRALHAPLEAPFIKGGKALSNGFKRVADKFKTRNAKPAPILDDHTYGIGPP
ncbi:MAG: hypothetical protein ACAH80_01030 [Alphaproteobacteria bacterium]